jgi:hypothetical protein
LSFNITGNTNPALFSSAPAVDGTGQLTYTTAANANGTATISLNIMDNGGTANGGVDTSANQSFIINVTSVNDEPSFTIGADETILEDAGAQTIPAWISVVVVGPPDEAAQTFSFNITGNNNPTLFSVAPAVDTTGQLTYTPAANANGSAMITLNVMDNGGVANGGDNTSVGQSFMINVTAVNDEPTFTAGLDQSAAAGSGVQTVAGWATGFSPGPVNEGGQLVQMYNVTVTSNPTVFATAPAIATNGTLTFTPTSSLAVATIADVEVTVTDNGGTANGGVDTSSPAQTFQITITAPPPTLVNDGVYNVTGNVTLNHPDGGTDLFSNDSFFGGTLDSTTPATAQAGSSVTINATDGSFTYNPPPGYTGPDSFTYSVTNGSGTSNATVSLMVNDMIWFIDNSGAVGNGTLATPFNTVAALQGSALDSIGDCIFIDETGSGNYSGPLTLLNSQVLVGNGSSTSITATCGITLAVNSATLPATGGLPPTLESDGIYLASGNTLRGLDIGNTGANTGLTGASVGTITINEMSISGTGKAVDLTNGTAAVTFDTISSTISNSEGIDLNTIAGAFTVTNATNITNSTNAGVSLVSNTGSFTFGSLNINNTTSNSMGLFVNSSGTLNINIDNDVSGGSINSGTGRAVDIDNTLLDISLTSVSSSTGTEPGIDLDTTTGNFTVTGDGTTAINGSGGTIQLNTGNAIILTDVTNISLSQLNMTDNDANGIVGIRVNGLAVSNASYNNIGDAVNEDVFNFNRDGLLDNGLQGTALFQNLNITNFTENGIDIVNEGTGSLDLDIISVSMDNNHDTFGSDAIFIQSEGSINTDTLIFGGTYNNIEFDVLAYHVDGSGTNIIEVSTVVSTNGGGVDNFPNGGGLFINATTGTTTFDINTNNFTGVQGSAVQIIGQALSNAQNITMNGTIGGANLALANVLSSDNADAIDLDFDGFFDASSTIDGSILVQNNTINFDDDGIGIDHRDAAGLMNVTVSDNTLVGINGDDASNLDVDDGIFLFSDDDIGVATASNLNVVASNNTITIVNATDNIIELVDVQEGNNACIDFAGNSGSVGELEIDNDGLSTLNVVQSLADLSSLNGNITIDNQSTGANFSAAPCF